MISDFVDDTAAVIESLMATVLVVVIFPETVGVAAFETVTVTFWLRVLCGEPVSLRETVSTFVQEDVFVKFETPKAKWIAKINANAKTISLLLIFFFPFSN